MLGSTLGFPICGTPHIDVDSYLPGPPKEPKIMDPILPVLSILGYWSIILGSVGGPGRHIDVDTPA